MSKDFIGVRYEPPTDEETGKYLLTIFSRGGGSPFGGGGGGVSLVACDHLQLVNSKEGLPVRYDAVRLLPVEPGATVRQAEIIASFPGGVEYLLFLRNKTSVVTREDLKQAQKDHLAECRECAQRVVDGEEPNGTEGHPGNYV